ncbi:MAG: endonuclease/exonuclease/phosphatase family protein [Bacteroidetes bacterium]|nr:endonuclease/exonuclease/phosphatase family protein [Bacteroidota bacterium]
MRKFIRYLILTGYILFLIALLLSCLARFVSPAVFWPLAFFGLAYPMLLLVNLVFLGYFLFRRKWKSVLITLAVILLSWQNLSNLFQPFSSGNEPPEGSFKVMSFNARNFDLYNWTNNKETRNEIFRMIKEEDADILCFQEFYKDKIQYFNTLDTILQFQKAKYYHEAYPVHVTNKFFFGVAAFSRFPIIERGTILFPGSDNATIFLDIVIDHDTVRLYNCHLESIRFDDKDYRFLDSLRLKINDKQIAEARNILSKLKSAFIKRAGQADKIDAHIRQCPYPVILCGDFNDTPFSYTYRRIRGELCDAFRESGRGIGKSYSGKFPSFRIDYIFYDRKISSYSYKTGRTGLSDHAPIMAWLNISKD